MKEIHCEKCGYSHLMEIIWVYPTNGKYSVEYRCRQTSHTKIILEKENPYAK